MSAKKIMKVGSGLYVLLPKAHCDTFGFEKGDPVVVTYVDGVGFLVTKQYDGGGPPVQVQRIQSMKNFMDGLWDEFRRKVKGLSNSAVNSVAHQLMGLSWKKGQEGEITLYGDLSQPPVCVLEDPFPIEDIKLLEVPLETSRKSSRPQPHPGRKRDRRSPVR